MRAPQYQQPVLVMNTIRGASGRLESLQERDSHRLKGLRRGGPSNQEPWAVGGVGLYTLDSAQLGPMRSILRQCRRIDDVSHRLERASVTLTERKVIECATALIMERRSLSGKDALTPHVSSAARGEPRKG